MFEKRPGPRPRLFERGALRVNPAESTTFGMLDLGALRLHSIRAFAAMVVCAQAKPTSGMFPRPLRGSLTNRQRAAAASLSLASKHLAGG
jgi:hypothetical protein